MAKVGLLVEIEGRMATEKLLGEISDVLTKAGYKSVITFPLDVAPLTNRVKKLRTEIKKMSQ